MALDKIRYLCRRLFGCHLNEASYDMITAPRLTPYEKNILRQFPQSVGDFMILLSAVKGQLISPASCRRLNNRIFRMTKKELIIIDDILLLFFGRGVSLDPSFTLKRRATYLTENDQCPEEILVRGSNLQKELDIFASQVSENTSNWYPRSFTLLQSSRIVHKKFKPDSNYVSFPTNLRMTYEAREIMASAVRIFYGKKGLKESRILAGALEDSYREGCEKSIRRKIEGTFQTI